MTKPEDEKREDEVLKRMLKTPPKPHKKDGGNQSATQRTKTKPVKIRKKTT